LAAIRAAAGDIAAAPGRRHAKGLDPYSGLPGAAGDAVAHHRFGGAARIPNFECVVIINNTPDPAFWQRSRPASANSVRVSSFCASKTSRGSRPQHSGLRWWRPQPMLRSLASSMPTMWSIPDGSSICPELCDPRLALFRRRRIIATPIAVHHSA